MNPTWSMSPSINMIHINQPNTNPHVTSESDHSIHSTMSVSDPSLHHTQPLKTIAIDYTPSSCTHCPISNTITLTYDHHGGSRWRSTTPFHHGTFTAKIQTPKGNTNGLNFNLYLSSLEGDKSQDEIDFEFLGKDKTIIQTNYYVNGVGNRERIHELGFDSSDEFHEYMIKWGDRVIEWLVDGEVVRKEERKEGERFVEKNMFLYASIWDASWVDEGKWSGKYCGNDSPYVCVYKDVHVPFKNLVE